MKSIPARVCLTVFLVLFSFPALAATITVTNNSDSGAGSLRQAIDGAADGDTIDFHLDAGSETIILASTLSWSGKGLTINGNNTLGSGVPITVSGNNTVRVFAISVGSSDVTMNDLTITDGYTTGNGGGIAFNDGNGAIFTLNRCTLRDNTGVNGGGGMDVMCINLTLNLNQCTFRGNSGGIGGGIYFDPMTIPSSMNLNQCEISGNKATAGGGIYAASYDITTLVNTTITGNTAELRYGGLYSSTICHMINTTVSANVGGTAGPGGVDAFKCYLLNSLVCNNTKGDGTPADLQVVLASPAYYSWYTSADGTISTQATAPNQNATYSAGALAPLADNGGLTRTMAVRCDAPAAGNGAFAYYNVGDGYYFQDTGGAWRKLVDWSTPSSPKDADKINVDQRGLLRSAPNVIGAYASTYYRSTASGAWSQLGVWEQSQDQTVWAPANFPPDAYSAGVTVQAGHTVNVDATTTTSRTSVQAGGTLIVDAGQELAIPDVTGVDVDVAGDLTNNGVLNCVNGTEVVFTGSVNSVLGGGSSTSFYDLTLDKAGGGTLAVQAGSVAVANALDVTSGIFDLSGFDHDLQLGTVLDIGADGRWIKHGDGSKAVVFYGQNCTARDQSTGGPQNLGQVRVSK
jgi:hypothetical protein